MLREFEDETGRQWRVWDVNPTVHARSSRPRGANPITVPDGWLCFESADERRRLSPIPPTWETADMDALRALWTAAQVVPPTARRSRVIGQA